MQLSAPAITLKINVINLENVTNCLIVMFPFYLLIFTCLLIY